MRLLVTGVSGLVGSNVAAAAAQQSWDVLGCFCDVPVELEGVRTKSVEMANRKACVASAMEFEPDVVVHAAGGVVLGRFEREPYIAQLDLVGAEHTLAAARAVRARYVLVSCDWVHSGYRPAGLSFSESDPPEPVNAYGRSKLACEQATIGSNVSWVISRAGDLYGVNLARTVGVQAHGVQMSAQGAQVEERAAQVEENAAQVEAQAAHVWERSGVALRLVRALREHTTVPAPAGVYRSPTYAWDYAQRVCELIAQGCEGVYNMGGPVSLGRHEWLGLMADSFGCSRELVQLGTQAAFLQACGEDPWVKLPSNTALSDEKTRAAIGTPATGPEQGLGLMREQLRRTLEPAGLRAR